MNRSALFVTLAPAITIPIVMIVYARGQHPWEWWQFLGLGLAAAGLLLLTIARLRLGNSFSLTPQARELVTGGLYRRVRHPVYVFGAVAIAGLFLYLNVLPALLVFLVVIPLQIVRARAEERVLEAHFGQQYRDYKARTWF
ncbi:MAG TPA: isoprenylcysteine carboxylmethyltransferase family protein [Terriglobales bacterium]|nr:isoprenylcysteine carboxylmethyltransferase family protein [Terriglobales bacterium]